MKRLLTAMLLTAAPLFATEPTSIAAGAVNALGIDLLRTIGKPDANVLLSPYSIQSAFDVPKGSANFDRMAPRRTDDYLCVSKIFHKTFLNLDERGTEAAAATAVTTIAAGFATEKPKPIEVHVDRPFVFAIQHRPSGACLFLGHVTDPR
jgi:serine protease inhibitor